MKNMLNKCLNKLTNSTRTILITNLNSNNTFLYTKLHTTNFSTTTDSNSTNTNHTNNTTNKSFCYNARIYHHKTKLLDTSKWIHPLSKLTNTHNTNTINTPNTPNSSIFRTGLMINNSLYPNSKVEFVTMDGSKNIKWYTCGPTVYDISHLGHARTYISFDVIRRVLESYFGYNVEYCMNITDIDDKIIQRSIEKKIEFTEFTRKYELLFFEDMKKLNVLFPTHVTRVTEYVHEIIKFIEKLIDNKYAYKSNGSVYFDIESYRNNHQYLKLKPEVPGNAGNTGNNTTTSNNSNITQNKNSLEHCTTTTADMDGILFDSLKDKKNKGDFALWKATKATNEPKWPSPFGEGRPGWHIECSAMCSHIFGSTLDIHSGGCDLKFPHHDNEIAQTEGYYNSQQWINYFIHTGHLNIKGEKMSKSLKNFKKISDVLENYNCNTFRILFMNHKWDQPMNYCEEELENSKRLDKYFNEFYTNLKLCIDCNHNEFLSRSLKFDTKDKEMLVILNKSKEELRKCLLNNFDTKGSLEILKHLISSFNKYQIYSRQVKQLDTFKLPIALSYCRYISKITSCFGLIYDVSFLEESNIGSNTSGVISSSCIIGTNKSNTSSSSSTSNNNIQPYIEALAAYREEIKKLAQKQDITGIFKSSDKLRDEILINLGVKIEDFKDCSKITYSTKEVLLKEKELEKEKENINKEKQNAIITDKLRKLNTPAKEYYKELCEYSDYDEEGVPSHDIHGKELSKVSVL